MSRRRYVYRKNEETGQVEAIEVDADYQSVAERMPVFTDRYMEGLRTADGLHDIGSRQKHAAYCRARGLAVSSDFTNQWAQAAEKRADYMQHGDKAAVREAVGRAMYELRSKRNG